MADLLMLGIGVIAMAICSGLLYVLERGTGR
ncbi:hypothetical protein JOC45_000012 [Gordonia hydrophobica]|nr:hypothetical protein [Gordonia hydrophobica]